MKKENGSSKSALLWIIFTVLILIVVIAAVLVFVFKVKIGGNDTNTNTTQQQTTETPSPSTKPTHKPSSDDVSIIPTMEDEIDADSAWTPTFELVWNDLMDELVG